MSGEEIRWDLLALPSSKAVLASALDLLYWSPVAPCKMATFFHLRKENSLQGLVLEMESVLEKPMKTLLLQELSWTLAAPPECRLEQTQRYAMTRELMQADSLGAFSGLSHHTSLHTCGETGVSADRSHWVQLPVMFLGVCSRDGTQPNILDYCHPGISHTRKIPNCPKPLVSHLEKPKACPWRW